MTKAKVFMDGFMSKLKSDDFIKDNQPNKDHEIDADFIAEQLLSYANLLNSGILKMRNMISNQDCADCLCRVCSRSVLNDSHNPTQKVTDISCNPCHHCIEVIETDADCDSYLPDTDV